MANFEHLRKKLHVEREKTVPYTFPFALGEDPRKPLIVDCVPAGTTNKPLTNAVIKRSAARGKGATFTADTIEEGAEVVADLYPEHVVRGWKNAFDENGKEIPYSIEEGRKLLGLLAQEAPDKLEEFAAWARDLDNFRQAQAEIVAKN
jgi:hypothetical protein